MDWLVSQLQSVQSSLMSGFAAELRAGGIGTAVFAVILGALHALTPGHGKAAIAAYFLGREAALGRGVRVALTGAMLHVLNGFALFMIMRFVLGAGAAVTGRPMPSVTVVGYVLIIVSGLLMLWQSLRPTLATHGEGAIAAGIGLLPCPLTISVLGFAWTQSSGAMIALVLVALMLGVGLTITSVAVAAMVARRTVGAAIGPRLGGLERGARYAQGFAGMTIVLIGLYTLARMQM